MRENGQKEMPDAEALTAPVPGVLIDFCPIIC